MKILKRTQNGKVERTKNLVKIEPMKKIKLHIGCGDIYFDGWINIDLISKIADKRIDVRHSIPYNNVQYIYCEHFIEHLTKNEGIRFVQNCYKSLADDGILRIATFDMEYIIDNCHSLNTEWKESCEIERFGGIFDNNTKCEFLNRMFRDWGHKFVYNREDLLQVIKLGGFTNIRECKINVSEEPELCNRESRFNSTLIFECIKNK